MKRSGWIVRHINPGGHYWAHHLGTLPLSQVTENHLKIEHPSKKFTVARSSNKLQRLDYMTGCQDHDDVIKWKHFPRYWSFVWGIHWSPVNSPHKGQWRRALMFSLICGLNKRLSKQSWSRWFETPSRSSWRHCNVRALVMPVVWHAPHGWWRTLGNPRHNSVIRWLTRIATLRGLCNLREDKIYHHDTLSLQRCLISVSSLRRRRNRQLID